MIRKYHMAHASVWLFFAITTLLSIFGVAAYANEVDVSAFVDKNQVQIGGQVQLSVRVRAEKGEPVVDISPITDFVVNVSGTSSSISVVGSKMTRDLVHTYQLLPKKTGTLTIPALNVSMGKAVYHTRPIRVEVSEEPPVDSGQREIFVEAEVSDSQVYQGQVFVYRFRVFAAGPIANARLQRPEFTGFSAAELEDQQQSRQVRGGRQYGVTGITVLLTPIKTGELVIDPAVLTCDLVRSNQRDPGFGFFFSTRSHERRTLHTKPIRVHVEPLPPYNGDASFSSLVGRFSLEADLSPERVKVGDSATITITLSGRGNIMDASRPAFQLPEGFKTYEDEPSEEIKQTEAGFSGKKIFKTAVVPTKAGEFQLNPVKVAVFNPGKKAYEVLSASLPPLIADPAEKPAAVAAYTPSNQAPLPENNHKKVDFKGFDILPVKADLSALHHSPGPDFRWFLVLIFSPGLLLAGACIAKKWLKKPDTARAVMAARGKQALREAAKTTDPTGAGLYTALVSAVFARAGIKGEALTAAEAEKLVALHGPDEETARRASALLTEIESLRYSGAGPDQQTAERLLSQTRKLVRRLIP